MDSILQFLNSIADYVNWVIINHLSDYIMIAVAVIIASLLILIVFRSWIMFLVPFAFLLIALTLFIMIVSGTANFDWDYGLLLLFPHFAVGYILYLIFSMAISKSN